MRTLSSSSQYSANQVLSTSEKTLNKKENKNITDITVSQASSIRELQRVSVTKLKELIQTETIRNKKYAKLEGNLKENRKHQNSLVRLFGSGIRSGSELRDAEKKLKQVKNDIRDTKKNIQQLLLQKVKSIETGEIKAKWLSENTIDTREMRAASSFGKNPKSSLRLCPTLLASEVLNFNYVSFGRAPCYEDTIIGLDKNKKYFDIVIKKESVVNSDDSGLEISSPIQRGDEVNSIALAYNKESYDIFIEENVVNFNDSGLKASFHILQENGENTVAVTFEQKFMVNTAKSKEYAKAVVNTLKRCLPEINLVVCAKDKGKDIANYAVEHALSEAIPAVYYKGKIDPSSKG
jgi:hypothetical protein